MKTVHRINEINAGEAIKKSTGILKIWIRLQVSKVQST